MIRKTTSRLPAIVLVFLLWPMLASGQRLPRAGGFSLWGTAGAAVPADSETSASFGISAGIDYFLTRSLSLGAMGGGWRNSTAFDADESEAYFDFVATYNWERKRFHPFAQAGAGLYRINPPRGSSAIKLGAFAGGGLDYFLGRTWAIEGAARYHFASGAGDLRGSFLELLGGVKFYF